MLFNSLDFALFLPIVFFGYWLLKSKLKLQNLFIVLASYIFYGWWDYRFLTLIVFSTLVDFTIGLLMRNQPSQRQKLLLTLSILVNLGFLGFFKYYNFFLDNFITAFSFFGYSFDSNRLNIILPVGISFYTFQTMSYTIDVYRGKLAPTRDFISFAAFVSFFPQLVAGPIERASNLLPQMLGKRNFNYHQAKEGIRLVLWGLFKKIAIADALAPSVDKIFSDYGAYSSPILVMGAIFFAFQIYCDFSGYSDIARGLAKMLGFELMVNFNFPYFSRSVAEFWRKWHISLSTWFRDYLYIPLGGSRLGQLKSIRNVFIIFLVSGFWHGANWTFIIWGGIHALFFIPSFVVKNNRKHLDDITPVRKYLPSLNDSLKIIRTFIIVTLAWVFFRANSTSDAINFIVQLFSGGGEVDTFLNPYDNQNLIKEFFIVGVLVFLEYMLITKIINLYSNHLSKGLLVDAALVVAIIITSPISDSLSFIYFQF